MVPTLHCLSAWGINFVFICAAPHKPFLTDYTGCIYVGGREGLAFSYN